MWFIVLHTGLHRLIIHVHYVCVGFRWSDHSLSLFEIEGFCTLSAEICQCFLAGCLGVWPVGWLFHLQEIIAGCCCCLPTVFTRGDTRISQSTTTLRGPPLKKGLKNAFHKRHHQLVWPQSSLTNEAKKPCAKLPECWEWEPHKNQSDSNNSGNNFK